MKISDADKADLSSGNLKIPKIIHFVVPTKISSDQSEIIARAKDAHPEWEIRIWDDSTELQCSPLNRYLRKCKSGAQFADLVRLGVVFREGGVYLDGDMRVLRPLDPLLEWASFFIASEDGYNLTNAAFGATRHHPALQSLIKFLDENEPDWDLPPTVTTGPIFFAKLLRWRSDVHFLPRDVFYPYHNYHTIRKPHKLSYCEHTWTGSWMEDYKSHGKPVEPKVTRLRKSSGNLVRRVIRPLLKAVGNAVARQSVSLPSYCVTSKIVVSTVHGHQMVANGSDYSITPKLVRDGFFELGNERFVAKTIKGGDWFVDVGANIGIYSLIAAGKCGPFGRVFAFEPNPAVAELLMETAALNWCHDRISVRTVALSDKTGKRQLQVLLNRTGDARLVNQSGEVQKADGAFAKTRRYLTAEEIVEVECDTLDAAFPVDVPIKMIKIDAEGHEWNILAGAERLLNAKAFDYVMVEALIDVALPEWKSTYHWLSRLADFGYDVCTADYNGDLLRHPSLHVALESIRENNLIFAARK